MKAKLPNDLLGLVLLRSTWRHAIENGDNGFVSSKPDQFKRGRHRLQVIDRRSAGYQNQVGGFCCRQSCLLGTRRGINQDHSGSRCLRRCEDMG